MKGAPARQLSIAIGLALLAAPAIAQEGASADTYLSRERVEGFLAQARIVSSRPVGDGVTNTRRATMIDGDLTHDAQIQTVDVARTVFGTGKATELNFKDTYRYNIAGYRLARLLGIENVPISVARTIEGHRAAVTWWIDNVAMNEGARVKTRAVGPDPLRFRHQFDVMYVFDELIQNRDRNLGNILWTADWTMWLIDHTRAFRLGRDLLKPERLERCDRALLAALRALTAESVKDAAGDSLTKDEIRALLARRDRILQHFEQRITDRGEASVLF